MSQFLHERILSEFVNPQTDSPLFSLLPGEVRDKIFSYVLTDHPDPGAHMQYSKQTCYTRPSYEAHQSTDTRVLRTCRAVYRETWFKPFLLREHVRWATAPDRAPPGKSGVPYEVRHMLSRLLTQQPEQDKVEIERLRIFAQMYKLEEGLVAKILAEPALLAPRIVTLTIRHTDWWFWEDDEPLRFEGGWIEDVCKAMHWCTNQFCIELESLERKKDQIDKIADQMIKKWYFKRCDGVVLYADALGRKESRWSGDSTWGDRRWVRDETEPGRLDYYIVSVTFRPRIDIERSGGTVDREVFNASQKDWFDESELKIHLGDESRIEDPSPFEYVGDTRDGGGQPCDHGTITPLSGEDLAPIPITNVRREGLRCIIQSPKPIAPGTEVRQEIDWKRRWDHMQQHTGQHLLSAVMMKNHELKTLGWGMGTDGGFNYLDLQRKPTDEEMQAIQMECAEKIRENLSIKVDTPDDAKDHKLPGDYDKCCGTHLSQTSHISLIILGSTQSVHGKNCRLSFIAGDRAINLASSSVSAINNIAKMMSVSSNPTDVVTRATALSDSVTDLKRAERKLLLEVAKFESEHAIRSIVQNKMNAYIHRYEGSTDFINKIVGETRDFLEGTEFVVVIAIGEPKGGGPVVIVGDKVAVDAMAKKVKSVVKDIKGGGTGGKWQGKVKEWTNADLVALKDVVES
ncbi:Alanyl-tRNA editing protein Aarsd1 [Fusarium culmorum]|uniref:Alanyl-tRNA editing protein Aarsd1 n=1 Tax=Fusarium culmorum TaxID=5516 RepID=A0A2T4GV66_FUSCU|nr:Alanyl-tRNA editing protein Aarsd1 [Fusarium culmorum]